MKVTTDGCCSGVGWKVDSAESIVDTRGPLERGSIRILDIGAGTGLLALMLAQKTTGKIDAIEMDKDAFEQAKENFDNSPWTERVNIYHGDARNFSFPVKYDVIVSNPPFYENELKSPDERKNMAHHGGLALNELLEIIFQNLNPDGKFYLLLPSKRAVEAGLLLSNYEFRITESMMVRQSTLHDYFRVFFAVERRGNIERPHSKNEMSIWNEKKEYTLEFVALLRDYYLYL